MDEIAVFLAKYPKQAAQYSPDQAFQQLADPDPAVRLVGAKWLAKKAHAAVSNFTEYWLKDPATFDRLLPLLNDPDPLVVEELIRMAKMMVDPRYGNRDKRVIPRALELLKSDRGNTRIQAACLLTNFEDESLAEPLLALFGDPKKEVRSIVVSEIGRPACRWWSAGTNERVRLAALEKLQDRTVDVRCAAAKLLVGVGKPEDVPTLKRGLKDIKGRNWRQDYRESIDMLEQRLTQE